MKTLKFYNRVLGWSVFAIAAVVYLLTLESTASLWDCGEFIASSNKLQVMHSPGAPVFMIVARFFSLFAFNDVSKVAIMVNAFSGLASAFTILFLFWTITHLAVKIVNPGDNPKPWQMVAILGSSVVGALAYTFSDTFWFSAVEGEVYASSSLFTAVVFWAILKWENEANEKYANRWLILIAYLMGLSIGVHLLNLLAIPAIGMVYYFKKYNYTRKGMFWALVISVAILGAVMLIIPGVVWLAGQFELLFVNGFGLPFNSGVLFFVALIIAGAIYGIIYTQKKGMVLANTVLLAFSVILIGYSSFTMTVIRSRANPPLDMNNPENIFSLLSYLNREQYGDYPLLRGPNFNARPNGVDTLRPNYTPVGKKYVATDYKIEYTYDTKDMVLFPRMWSSGTEPPHMRGYAEWAGLDEDQLFYKDQNGIHYDQPDPNYKITFGDNLKYLFRYQLEHMYFRYFMWNFAGRQNDEQGDGGPLKGNWISGINFIDNIHLGGDMAKLPEAQKNHPSRNTYFLLPLILGLLGIYFQFSKHRKDFSVVAMLFFMTGIAIVLYLNQPPYQPRERDYAYAGSFYAFAIWIGLGVLGIISMMGEKSKRLPVAITVAGACLILVPGRMAEQNWNDHDRSGRYMARELAHDYLNSCAPNAILFTHGDNDTYPLWYAQQVEGIRTDVRVVNTALLYDDDYINQMRQKAFKSDPLPISLPPDTYRGSKKGITTILKSRYFGKAGPDAKTPVIDTTTSWGKNIKIIFSNFNRDSLKVGKYVKYPDYISLKYLMDNWVSKPSPERKWNYGNGPIDFIPTQKYMIPVNKDSISYDIVPKEDRSQIVNQVIGTLRDDRLTRADLIILDIIATNNWKRPIYFVSGRYLRRFGLEEYIKQTGLATQLVPEKTGGMGGDYVATNTMYNNMMNRFYFKNSNNPHVYLDEFHRGNLINIGQQFSVLARDLIDKGEYDKAKAVLDRGMKVIGPFRLLLDYYLQVMMTYPYAYVDSDKAFKYSDKILTTIENDLEYYNTFGVSHQDLQYEEDAKRSVLSLFIQIDESGNESVLKKLAKAHPEMWKMYVPYREQQIKMQEAAAKSRGIKMNALKESAQTE